MTGAMKLTTAFFVLFAICVPVWGQEAPVEAEEQSRPTVDAAQDELDELTERVNQSEQAQRVRAGILKPIYSLAETFSFSAFHWVAFAIMVTGVVSFALQLTLGKLVVLSKFGFSPSEILSDALGLGVSLIGLVLTTQAATENSNFTASAFAVISSTCGCDRGFRVLRLGAETRASGGRGEEKSGGARSWFYKIRWCISNEGIDPADRKCATHTVRQPIVLTRRCESPMSLTVEDVARKAKVSISTVSRVLNRPGLVNETTRKRVEQAISQLGYRPNLNAQGLMRQERHSEPGRRSVGVSIKVQVSSRSAERSGPSFHDEIVFGDCWSKSGCRRARVHSGFWTCGPASYP